MSCTQVAEMTSLVAMRSSCPRNPPGVQSTARSKGKTVEEGYGAEVLNPGPHDVLLGRGGGTNNHGGNINFRKLVNAHKMRYLSCSKIDKPNVARDVVELWKKLQPPGRFLVRKDEVKKETATNEQVVWIEVPERKAREKASQCLRERTPEVIPLIQEWRKQQDRMTEQGVSMVQKQLKMQLVGSNDTSLQGMAAALHRNANPMPAMSYGGTRRGSMPMMNPSGGGAMVNDTLPQQQPHMPFHRRVSAPHLASSSGNSLPMPVNATAMMEAAMMEAAMMGQMNPGFGMMGSGFVGSDGMFDPYCASSMTAMQLQQQHQMQMKQLQQQQMLQQQQWQMQQQRNMALINLQAANMNLQTTRSAMGGMDAPAWSMLPANQVASHQGLNGSGSNLSRSEDSGHSAARRVTDAPAKAKIDLGPVEILKPDKSTSAGIATVPCDAPDSLSCQEDKGPSKRSRGKKQKKMQQPPAPKVAAAASTEKTPQTPSTPTGSVTVVSPVVTVVSPVDPPAGDEFDCPLPLTGDGEDDEVGIEQYRETLFSYMAANNITNQAPNAFSDHEESSVESFPAWPEEGDHPECEDPKPKRRAAPETRKVERHKSGQSMMSCKTFKSHSTSLSGLSMLSDMMSMESGSKLSLDDKMGASKRFSSNASIMSELTDISHTIDGLGLDDDDM